MRRTAKPMLAWFVIAWITLYLLLPQSTAAQVKPVRRVLIFYELGLSSPAVELLDQQIRVALENTPFQVELYREYLETTLFPDPVTQQEFREWYIHKYRDRKPDLIVSLGRSPIAFMVEAHEKAFSNIPIVFGGAEEPLVSNPKLADYFTGVWERFEPAQTLEAALRLLPNTRHVAVVGGTSEFDRRLEALFKEKLHSYEGRFDFTYLTDLDMPTLLERLKHLPDNTIVLYTHIGQDAAGTRFVGASQADPLVADVANAPIFGPSDVDMGHGEVGGYLQSFAAEGKFIGESILRILNGTRPQDIPVVIAANAYIFDSQALRRWGLRESKVPPGSIVLNRQLTVWESYKWYIISAVALILFEAILISGLVWQRARRRKAEAELAITYDRLRLAVQAGKSVGWDWDVGTGRDQRFGDLQTMFAISSDTYSGQIEEFDRSIHAEDRELVQSALSNARQSRNPYNAEFRIIRADGTVRWITASGKFYYDASGEAERMVGMAVDITERKMAEDAIAALSSRLIEAQEEERRRIARELHDDYNQRLAMLAIDLEKLAENVDGSSLEAAQQLQELFNRVSEVGADLHSLSHSLHSSTLETLGLAAGIRAFCQEFAEQQGIQVDFAHENVPHGIPGDAALCIFRIAQEALRNIKRHSGAKRAEVRLEWLGEKLHLSVSDHGRGFDPNKPSPESGIGIRSMEERLRPFGGRLEIYARPLQGTRIDAWLPFTVSSQAAD